MPQGTTSINFGAFPGVSDTSVAVTGQAAILSGSLVEAFIFPAATADHSIDEHLVNPPRVVAATIVAATGFTIYGFGIDGVDAGGDTPRIYGLWNVAWVWN